jgi:hypothetical protein
VKWAALVELLRRLVNALERWRRGRKARQRQAQRDEIEADPIRAAQRMFGGPAERLHHDQPDADQAAPSDDPDHR